MEKDKSSFDFIGKAWNTAKIYSGSNTVNRLDAIVESDTLKTLGEYVKDPRNMIETKGIDFDAKADDRLQKYNIVRITPTKHLDEVDNLMELYLITDEHGHDIGTYEITENGPVFKLSPKIKKGNNSFIDDNFSKNREADKEFLKSEYDIDTMEKLVERLAKGESLTLTSVQKGKELIKNKYMSMGNSFEEEKDEKENKIEGISNEDQDALDSIPADMRGEAVKFAKDRGLKVKDILIVNSPKELSGEIDNRTNQISRNGGPVILIRTGHGGADSLGDDVYAFQDGHAIQNERNDDMLEDLMNQHKGEGYVKSLNDDKGDELEQEMIKIMEEMQAKIEAEQEEIAQVQYAMENFEPDNLEQQEEFFSKLHSQIDMHQEHLDEVIAEGNSQIRALARERYPLRPFDEISMDTLGKIETDNAIQDDAIDSFQEDEEEKSLEEAKNNEEEDAEKSRWETADPLANH